MGKFARASGVDAVRSRFEGPTWAALFGCYFVWGLSIWQFEMWGLWVLVPAALATALHSSLTHEVLHGHPTRNGLINEALIFPALGLFIPYRRFRDLHLKHHNDERLTDPYDDPESFYLPMSDWGECCVIRRSVLRINATLAGRLVIGPALALWAFWRTDAASIVRGDRAVIGAWIRHGIGLVPIVIVLSAIGMPVWVYAICIAYPAMSLIMIRSFIEHRAADSAAHRTAIVDAHWFWRLLFLNNNYHAVHHGSPTVSWYRIPALWRTERDDVLDRNGAYFLPGYGAVFRQWGLRQREPMVHPIWHREEPDETRQP